MGKFDYVISDLPVYKAALHDDWESVSQIFEQDPELMTKRIGFWSETPLITAVGTNTSNDFVEKLVERIVAVGAADKLFTPNYGGDNPLHYAAKVGNTTAARLLVAHNPVMTRVMNWESHTPLTLAAWHVNKEMLQYLLSMTPEIPPNEEGLSPFTGIAGGDLITLTLKAGFYDVALEIIHDHPNIVLEEDRNHLTALQVLAMTPESFPSGSRLLFWGRLVYSWAPLKTYQERDVNILISILRKFTAGCWKSLQYVAPAIKNIQDLKITHARAHQIVKRICETVIEKVDYDLADKILGTAITTAVKNGTHELIEECILTYPGIIWYDRGGFNLFLDAIRERQERVYNLLYQISGHKVYTTSRPKVENNENMLHVAAKLAPPHRRNVRTGAALQMQHAYQWFQEVEKQIEPSYRDALNGDKKTPRMVFDEEHHELQKEGERWMKETASSYTVVATLIVTVAYAVAFQVPGGIQDAGNPLFLNDGVFMLFIVSDAVALFSSSTAVLMFSGIHISQYSALDYIYALPKRLTIGLVSLFLSLAATMIAFSATLALLLRNKVSWIAAPLVIATSIPVFLFAALQFPLLVELISSTYGRSIFHKQNSRMLH